MSFLSWDFSSSALFCAFSRLSPYKHRFFAALAATLVLWLSAPPAHAQNVSISAQRTLGSGFGAPQGVAVGANGNVYVADTSNNAVKEIVAVNGRIPASPTINIISSGFSGPIAVAVDASGNVYVADSNNNAVKEIVAVNGQIPAEPTINTIATGFNHPTGVAVDASGNVYVADSQNNAVKQIVAVGGQIPASPTINTIGGFSGPVGLAVDTSGNVYVADSGNDVVKEIMAVSGQVPVDPTINILDGGFLAPNGVAVDTSGNVYVADSGNEVIKEMVAVNGQVPADPTINSLASGDYFGIAIDHNGSLYLTDPTNSVITQLSLLSYDFGNKDVWTQADPVTLTVTFLQNTDSFSYQVVTQSVQYTDFVNTGDGSCVSGSSYEFGNTCTITVAVHAQHPGPRLGAVVVQADSSRTDFSLYANAQGPQASFAPVGWTSIAGSTPLSGAKDIAVDSNRNVYVANNSRIAVLPTTCGGTCSFARLYLPNAPNGLALDGAGNVHYSVSGGINGVLAPITDDVILFPHIFAGGFTTPQGIAIDGAGNTYIADNGAQAVYKLPAGCVASSCSFRLGGNFSFNSPYGVAVDSVGNVYVADAGADAVYSLTPNCAAATCVTTLGGGFSAPHGVAVNSNGYVYVADTGNQRFTVMPPACADETCVTALPAVPVSSGNTQISPSSIAVDGQGNIYVVDSQGSGAVWMLDYTKTPQLSFPGTVGGVESTAQTVTLVNTGNQPLVFSPAYGLDGDDPYFGGDDPTSFLFSSSVTSTCPRITSASSPASLAPSQSCTYALAFRPEIAGFNSAVLNIGDSNLYGLNTGDSYTTQQIALYGTGVVGAASAIHAEQGNNQATMINTSFYYPLAVRITDANGLGISGQTVFFHVGVGAATAQVFPLSCQTDGTGRCAVFAQANGTAGSYQVLAISGTLQVAFSLTNLSAPPNYVVNSAAESLGDDTACTIQAQANHNTTSGEHCTLRDALLVSEDTGGGLITFDAAVFATPTTITLNTVSPQPGALEINSNVTVKGPTGLVNGSLANLVTVDGNHSSGVFATCFCATNASIANLNIVNGDSYEGGGIYNSGSLSILNSTFSGNSATDAGETSLSMKYPSGGAVANEGGQVTIFNSTFTDNHAIVSATGPATGGEAWGGAIYNSDGTATIANSTITNNTAQNDQPDQGSNNNGAGIANYYGSLTIANTTITNNVNLADVDYSGAGIYNYSGSLVLENSIVSGNREGQYAGAPLQPQDAATYEDIHDDSGRTTWDIASGDFGGNLVGFYNAPSGMAPGAIGLAPLANYGGATQTMLPLPGSPAICAGLAVNLVTSLGNIDQRGLPNTNTAYSGYNSTTPCVDAGAVQTNYSLAFTTQPSSKVSTSASFPVAVTLRESGTPFTALSVTIPLIFNGTGNVSGLTPADGTSSGVESYTLQATEDPTSGTLTASLGLNPLATLPPAISAISKSFSTSSTSPYGYVDSVKDATTNLATITPGDNLVAKGWAADLVTPGPVSSVTVYIDGNSAGTATLGASRPDVAASLGSAYGTTGWVFTMPAASVSALSVGPHRLTATATDAESHTQQLVGNILFVVASNSTSPTGYVDSAKDATTNSATVAPGDALLVKGWAADLLTPGTVASVTVSIDGTAVGTATLGISRPDIKGLYGAAYANTGWSFTYPAASISALAVGPHHITATATDSQGHTLALHGNLIVNVATATTSILGYVDTVKDKTVSALAPRAAAINIPLGGTLGVSGWAAALLDSGPADSVTIYIDGAPVVAATLGVTRSDIAASLGPAYSATGWTASLSGSAIDGLSTGPHQVTAYATDTHSHLQKLVGSLSFNATGAAPAVIRMRTPATTSAHPQPSIPVAAPRHATQPAAQAAPSPNE